MTAVVGVIDRGHVYLGADSHCAAEGVLEQTATPKIWRNVRYIVGMAGNGAWFATVRGAVLRADRDPCDWLPGALYRAGRKVGAEYPDTSGAANSPLNGALLLAQGPRLWYADEQLNVCELAADTAIGANPLALRSVLHRESGKPPLERMLAALDSVAYVSAEVSPPFRWLSTNGKGGKF